MANSWAQHDSACPVHILATAWMLSIMSLPLLFSWSVFFSMVPGGSLLFSSSFGGGGGCYGIGGLCTISVVSTGGGINRWSTYLSMHTLGVATRAILVSVLPLEIGGIGGLSAWAVIFLSSPNVVGWCALFGGESGGTSSSSLKLMSSGIDFSPEGTCESSAEALLPFGGAGNVCSSCGVFGIGLCLGAKYGASMSSSSSVS